MKTAMEVAEKRLADHGHRLRSLERARNIAAGVGVLASIIAGYIKINFKINQQP